MIDTLFMRLLCTGQYEPQAANKNRWKYRYMKPTMKSSRISFSAGFPVLVVFAGIFLGCAYFNTFYNTKKAFEDGVRRIEDKTENDITVTDLQSFDICLRKGSKLLEVYPGSKYVDDTLFLMGRSFYYKKDYVEAIRKFEELKKVFPDSEFNQEAALWWGKSYVRLADYAYAEQKFNELLAMPDLKKKYKNEALFEIAGMSYRQANYREAVDSYQELTGMIDDDEVLAKVWLQIGFSHYYLNDCEKAAESFLEVSRYKPTDNDNYQALIFAGKSYKLNGQFDLAREIFNKLLRDGKYAEYFPEIRLELTDCLTLEGKVEEAIEEFEDIAEFYPRTAASTRAFGEIGLIYYDMRDYRLASALFDSSLKGVRDSVTTDRIRPLAEYLKALQTYHASIDTSLESLEEQGGKDEKAETPAGQDSVKKEESEENYAEREREYREMLFEDSYARHFYLAGELFKYKIGIPDSARKYFEYIVDNFPKSSYAPRSLLMLGELYEQAEDDENKRKSLERLISQYPDNEYVNLARSRLDMMPVITLHDSLKTVFLKAESLFFDASQYEEAVDLYASICNNHPLSEFAPKSRYILGWYYENAVFDYKRALEEYEILLDDYPQFDLYARVNAKAKEIENLLKNPPKIERKKDDEDQARRRRPR